MTARELIKQLYALGEENLDKEILIFNGPSYYTPYKVCIIPKNSHSMYADKIMID